MFNAERLLGQLMGQALGGQLGGHKRKRGQASGLGGMMGGLSTGTKAQLGLGLLGVAMAAFEHYQNKPGAAPQPMAGPGAAMPPPPPAAAAVPPPPPMPAAQVAVRTEQAMHLLRAMITAAHADGLMDPQEREAILGRAREAGLDAEEIEALDAEIRAPFTLEQLVVRTPAQLRPETYAAALIAITADTAEERAFLDRLASQLQLDDGARRDIHAQLGVDAA